MLGYKREYDDFKIVEVCVVCVVKKREQEREDQIGKKGQVKICMFVCFILILGFI